MDGVSALPRVPHGNSFQVHFAAPIGGLERAVLDLAQREGIWLLSRLGEGLAPDVAYGEIAVEIGLPGKSGRHKQLARHRQHGCDQIGIGDIGRADLPVHHESASGGGV